jgi:DHA1 family tetracycline resistance protein-like MFS transporter
MPPRQHEQPSCEESGFFSQNHADCNDESSDRRQSSIEFSTLQQLDPNERRPSAYRRKSFLVQFSETKGPPQITLLMMLVAIGLGSTIGVVPAVMTDRFASLNHGYNGKSCSDFDISEKPNECLLASGDAQNVAATSHLISNVLTFLTSSLIGSLSDEHGRRGILIIGLFVSTLSPLMLFIMQLIPTMSPWWYYGMSMSTGLVNWTAVALSSLADVLPAKFRAPGIGLFLAGFMLGFSFAPLFSIFLSHLYVALASFLVASCGLMCTIAFVPETLPPRVAEEAKRRRQQLYSANNNDTDSGTWCHRFAKTVRWLVVRPVREMSILNRNQFFRLISLLAFFSGMVSSGDQLLLVYYIEEQLGFTDQDVSVMFLIIGIMGLLAQGVLLKPLNDCVGEKMVVALCFFIGAINNTMYGLAQNKATIYAAVTLSALTGMAFPTISAIKSNNVDESEQGRIQGALYSLQALASGIGPILLRYVYSHAKHTSLGPGSMFIFAGLLELVAVYAACALPKELANARREEQHTDYSPLVDNDSTSITGLLWDDSNLEDEATEQEDLPPSSSSSITGDDPSQQHIQSSASYGSV